jgi:hypothetical protein
MQFLINFGFVEGTPLAVAKFLISRRGLSKQMIGEFLGNVQNPFHGAVLECVSNASRICAPIDRPLVADVSSTKSIFATWTSMSLCATFSVISDCQGKRKKSKESWR